MGGKGVVGEIVLDKRCCNWSHSPHRNIPIHHTTEDLERSGVDPPLCSSCGCLNTAFITNSVRFVSSSRQCSSSHSLVPDLPGWGKGVPWFSYWSCPSRGHALGWTPLMHSHLLSYADHFSVHVRAGVFGLWRTSGDLVLRLVMHALVCTHITEGVVVPFTKHQCVGASQMSTVECACGPWQQMQSMQMERRMERPS